MAAWSNIGSARVSVTFSTSTYPRVGDVIRFGNGTVDVVTGFVDHGAPRERRYRLTTALLAVDAYFSQDSTWQVSVPSGPRSAGLVADLSVLADAHRSLLAALNDGRERDDEHQAAIDSAVAAIANAIRQAAEALVKAATA